MLILLPTYKRIESLLLVIESLYNAHLPVLKNNVRPRLVVLNNFPGNTNLIELLVEKAKNSNKFSKNWETIILSRSNTLPPVENWYSAVFDYAKLDEIVFFVGDDDPITKDSLVKRYEFLKKNNGTLILGRLVHGLIFSDNCSRYYFSLKKEEYSFNISKLDLSDIWNWNSVHLSNHCFIFNSIFINSFNQAISWSENQGIGDLNQRKLFITYYIAISIKLNGGVILGYDAPVIYRGNSLEELRFSKYSVRSWNLGYISGLAYNLLNNNSLKYLKELNEIREHLKDVYLSYYITIILDKSITRSTRLELDKSFNEYFELSISNLFYSLKLIFKYKFGLQSLGLYVKNSIYSRKISPSTDFDQIYLNKKS